MKRDELNIKFRKMYWLLRRNSELSIYNKLVLYKQVLPPVWSYDIQLWGCASDSALPKQSAKVSKRLGIFVAMTFIGIEKVTDITRLASSNKKKTSKPHQQ
jgi:hypothetical protein